MGYGYTTGSIRDFSLDGVSFRVVAAANFTEKPSQYENEAIATSGRAMVRKTKIVQVLESVELGTDAADRALLAGYADSNDLIACSYKDAAGNVYKTPACTIHIEGNSTENNSTTITVQPIDPWTVQLAS